MTDDGDVSYLLSKGRGDEFVIEIPRTWKITFATVNPASNGMGGRESHCVRVYEMPGSKLRAVFDSIVSIRDLSIPLARKMREEVGEAKWAKDSTGSFSESSSVKVKETFVAQPTALTSGEEGEKTEGSPF